MPFSLHEPNTFYFGENFGQENFWRTSCDSPNPPKFSPSKIFVLYGTDLTQECVKFLLHKHLLKHLIIRNQ